jgi:hypothetical protein
VRALALFFVLVLGAVLAAPVAAAERLQANVVSWSPNVVRPGSPVYVVLQLAPGPSAVVEDDTPVAGAQDVQVVLHGRGETRRFPTTALGSGRYRAEIAFPKPGSWAVRVAYRPGRHSALEEILLGKGGACVAPCLEAPAGESTPARRHDRLTLALALVAAGLLSVAALSGLARARARATRTRSG